MVVDATALAEQSFSRMNRVLDHKNSSINCYQTLDKCVMTRHPLKCLLGFEWCYVRFA